ncbi:hypothetical protein TNCV_54841 [Trichonephila clavipes]|nr:hypothetical protein TNCV_54841 [Trichonephila clavipes]
MKAINEEIIGVALRGWTKVWTKSRRKIHLFPSSGRIFFIAFKTIRSTTALRDLCTVTCADSTDRLSTGVVKIKPFENLIRITWYFSARIVCKKREGDQSESGQTINYDDTQFSNYPTKEETVVDFTVRFTDERYRMSGIFLLGMYRIVLFFDSINGILQAVFL